MKKVLITGVSGFAGTYLARELLKNKENEVTGTINSSENKELKDSIDQIKIDLRDKDEVDKLIKTLSPDIIFHLAALTSPRQSFEDPSNTINSNILMQVNLLESVRKNDPDSRVVSISSGDIYGLVKEKDLPIDEDTPLNPTNPYAISKIAQDFLGLQYFNAYKLNVIRLRPFNHIGPGQPPNFVVPTFTKQIAEIEKGKLDKLRVGNLESKRDFTDVRDIVRAYVLASEKGVSGDVYNIGSGRSHRISDVLEVLKSLSSAEIIVEEDASRLMPSDNPDLVCDFSKFKDLTGWEPQISLEQTLKETLDYWRSVV